MAPLCINGRRLCGLSHPATTNRGVYASGSVLAEKANYEGACTSVTASRREGPKEVVGPEFW